MKQEVEKKSAHLNYQKTITMKRFINLLLLSLLGFSGSMLAQDDDIYSTPKDRAATQPTYSNKTQSYDPPQEQRTSPQNPDGRQDQGISENKNYNSDDYYDYEYAARIKRFHRATCIDYYDPFYTNLYFYNGDPYAYGTSIYYGYNWYRPYGYGIHIGIGYGFYDPWYSWYGPGYYYGYGYPAYGYYPYHHGYYGGGHYYEGGGYHSGGYNNRSSVRSTPYQARPGYSSSYASDTRGSMSGANRSSYSPRIITPEADRISRFSGANTPGTANRPSSPSGTGSSPSRFNSYSRTASYPDRRGTESNRPATEYGRPGGNRSDMPSQGRGNYERSSTPTYERGNPSYSRPSSSYERSAPSNSRGASPSYSQPSYNRAPQGGGSYGGGSRGSSGGGGNSGGSRGGSSGGGRHR